MRTQAKTGKPPKARENASDQFAIGFGSDWSSRQGGGASFLDQLNRTEAKAFKSNITWDYLVYG